MHYIIINTHTHTHTRRGRREISDQLTNKKKRKQKQLQMIIEEREKEVFPNRIIKTLLCTNQEKCSRGVMPRLLVSVRNRKTDRTTHHVVVDDFFLVFLFLLKLFVVEFYLSQKNKREKEVKGRTTTATRRF